MAATSERTRQERAADIREQLALTLGRLLLAFHSDELDSGMVLNGLVTFGSRLLDLSAEEGCSPDEVNDALARIVKPCIPSES